MSQEQKLTKTELRSQQVKLAQLQKYLPTLQLKKMMLQAEISQTQAELEDLQRQFFTKEQRILQYASLFSERNIGSFFSSLAIEDLKIKHENIAGIDIPLLEQVVFADATYSLFDTPVWYESALEGMQGLISTWQNSKVVEEKKRALEKELREVSIRVNLFEKIMIPRAVEHIKRIKIFLCDQQLAAVSQAKVAKKKILLQGGS